MYCELCEQEFEREQLEKYNNSYYCPDCLKKMKIEQPIGNYYFKPRPAFYHEDGKVTKTEQSYKSGNRKLYMGMELEIDNGKLPRTLSTKINSFFDNEFFYCKTDSSLGSNGIEIVTMPATLKAFREYIPLNDLMELCKSFGYRSNDTNTCGLHVHVNRNFFGDDKEEQDANIAKLILIINRFWDGYIVPFSRRDNGSLNTYARLGYISKVYNTDTKKVLASKCPYNSDRHQAVNLGNEHTVEIRIFKGSLNYNTVISTLEFVDRICRLSKKISLNTLMSLTWSDLVGVKSISDELKAYLETRNITPDTIATEKDVVFKIEKPKKKNKSGKIDTNCINASDICTGTMVLVRNWNDMEECYGISDVDGTSINVPGLFTANMSRYCGHTGMVEQVCVNAEDSNEVFFTINFNGNIPSFLFSDKMVTLSLVDNCDTDAEVVII